MSSPSNDQKLEATLSLLIMSIASNAMMALGLTPDPQTNKTEVDKNLARFNIDLLVMLREKTKNNLSSDEDGLLNQVLQDLQMRYVQLK
jgi:hypothetical protein